VSLTVQVIGERVGVLVHEYDLVVLRYSDSVAVKDPELVQVWLGDTVGEGDSEGRDTLKEAVDLE